MTTTAELVALMETPSDFRAWLEAKAAADPGQIVGIARTGTACPLANFLTKAGAKKVHVGADAVFLCDTRANLPYWGWRFVHDVDALADHRPASFPAYRWTHDIQAAEALALLDRAA